MSHQDLSWHLATAALHSVLIHPLERVRGLLAVKKELVQQERIQDDSYTNPIDCLLWQIHLGSFGSLWHGSLQTVAFNVVPSFIMKVTLPPRMALQWFGYPPRNWSFLPRLAWSTASVLAQGLSRLLFTMPISHGAIAITHDVQNAVNRDEGDVVVVELPRHKFTSVWGVYRQAFAKDVISGLLQLYRGLGASLLGIAVYRGVYVLSNDLVPASINPYLRYTLILAPTTMAALPFDVLRRRVIQLPVTDRRSFVTYAMDVYYAEGLSAFFAGWSMAIVQTVTSGMMYAVAAVTVAQVKRLVKS
eukprot:TRINITY_DN4740_c0_g1_i1.p1 TRINITY_DN4740_c0_g1~~TRINITY_DN4740_c0_g1_i1.p1  ORF type:complete len:303 (+),score=60.99 TRINITY_DN4740_c0_g1_i1:76-984(+)